MKAARFIQRWRVRLGHVFAVALVAAASPTGESLAAGCAVALAGAAYRVYAAGFIAKNEALSRSGPYARTRNPLYFGSFVMYLGFSVASGSAYVLAAFLPFFFVVYFTTIRLEEEYLRGRFGVEFEEYAGAVPQFFPALRARGGVRGAFRWERVRANREYEGAAGCAVVIAALVLKYLYL
ncbi:MAG: isoprenylcysteine carboxylmethyltransferase family protein [bacterium]